MAEKTAAKIKKGEDIAFAHGKRKTSVARTVIKKGNGRVRINSFMLDNYSTDYARSRVSLPLIIASDYIDTNSIDIKTEVHGGGCISQADAIASSISRALVKWCGSDDLLHDYQKFDRTLISGDHRQSEPHKPSQSSKGARHRRQKSYR